MFNFVALMSTRKTSVLISSLFFIADSVVTGHVIMRYLSIRPRVSTDFRGYFGSRFLMSVFGRKKVHVRPDLLGLPRDRALDRLRRLGRLLRAALRRCLRCLRSHFPRAWGLRSGGGLG